MITREITFPIIVEGFKSCLGIEKFLQGLLGESFGIIKLDEYRDEHDRLKLFYAVSPTKGAEECNVLMPEVQEFLKKVGWKPESERLPYPQISFENLNDYTKDKGWEYAPYSYIREMHETFPGIFEDCETNHEVTDKLIKAGVVTRKQSDPESSCSYFNFGNKRAAQNFVSKLNAWLKNKHEAMQAAAAY